MLYHNINILIEINAVLLNYLETRRCNEKPNFAKARFHGSSPDETDVIGLLNFAVK